MENNKATLSWKQLNVIDPTWVDIPELSLLTLPERVIQFGTGALLRGLPDDYIHRANLAGIFQGRILVVKSTDQGSTTAFEQQNSLYTLLVQGYEDGQHIVSRQVNAAISRVLSAQQQWHEILKTARSPEMEILISNTTEAGIVGSEGTIHDSPPISLAAKILAYLYARYRHFDADPTKGLVIIPTELITDNAVVLKDIILNLCHQQQLEDTFIDWVDQANYFCNSLVDRIVLNKVAPETLPYVDSLAIMAEPYRLWAIESDSIVVHNKLSFAALDPSIKIVPNIAKYKEIKLRLLNATHTLCCGLAILSGIADVKTFFTDAVLDCYIRQILFKEIGPSLLQTGILTTEADQFAHTVIDRFKNPFLSHQWTSIAIQFSSKIKTRVLPILPYWYGQHQAPPTGVAIGFAAYILLMQQTTEENDFHDDYRSAVQLHLQQRDPVPSLLADQQIWGESLLNYSGLACMVSEILQRIKQLGLRSTIVDYLFAQQTV